MNVNLTVTASMLISWVIVGALAGALAGRLAKFSKRGYGVLTKFGIGLVGAALGGIAFRLFRIDMPLLKGISVSAEDLVAALLGSLLFIVVLALFRRGGGG